MFCPVLGEVFLLGFRRGLLSLGFRAGRVSWVFKLGV